MKTLSICPLEFMLVSISEVNTALKMLDTSKYLTDSTWSFLFNPEG